MFSLPDHKVRVIVIPTGRLFCPVDPSPWLTLPKPESSADPQFHLHEKFDFLGYTFRARSSMTRKGKHFVNFSPAISAKAAQAIRTEVRSWALPQRSDKALEDLSRMFNPIV